MKNKNSITLAIIAKNEELGLEKAVSSCRDFVQEVIISVDSKSEDKTLEIAKKIADKVIIYEWTGSFADARNNIQKHVKTDWVLHLDGHEYVQSWSKLNEMLQKDVDSLFIKIIMESGFTFFFPRIIKKEIEWQHKVHNTPKAKKNMKYSDFIIVHDRIQGQTENGKEIRKRQREEMILENLGPESKTDKKNIRANFYLGNLFLDQKQWKKAIPCYKKVAKYGKQKSQKWLCQFHIGICYNELNKPLWALWHFLKAEKEQPNRWEIAKMLGTTYAFLGWHKMALEHWIDSFKVNQGEFIFCPIKRNDAQTWDFISLSFAQLGKVQEMRTACQQALREERENGPGLIPPDKIKILEAVVGQQSAPIDTKQTIEVCFLTYQRPERVPEILKQLKAQTIQNFRVNIWNNSGKDLDINNFPHDRIQVINSKENVGSQARFKLAGKTKGNPIIFFDDDQNLDPNFIEYNFRQYLKYGTKCILGWFTRTFHEEKYWTGKMSQNGNEVDYIATKAMILDREIIDKEPLLQSLPTNFAKVEDLYLCYLARMRYGMKLIQINRYTSEKPDGKDQYPNIDKEKAFMLLREDEWKLLKDGIKNFGGFLFQIRKGVWDEQILSGEMKASYYQIPQNPKLVVDIGAHIGGTAILAASKGAEVYAYEPETENYKLLLENIKLNGLENKIHCFKKAIGKPGQRQLHLNPDNSGMTSLSPIGPAGEKIETIPIEQVFKNIAHCDLLKIDCEEAEYEFLYNLPVEKIDRISMELHKGEQQKAIIWLKMFYQVETKRALDETSLMVFCTKKIK